ncbi:hypothetical protein ACHAXM_001383, partial [Skeletonema potamos]
KDITTLLVIGHGTTSSGGNVSDKLLEADVHYIVNERCEEQYGKGSITDDMICAADIVQDQDSCQGDSGGPLFTRLSVDGHKLFTQVGVVSWGNGCAEKKWPGVYSRVAANADWIDKQVCKGSNGDKAFSPLSCTADGKIRDYALESLTGTSSVSRRTKKNFITNDVRGVLYGGDELQVQQEVCELLGGSVTEDSSTPTVEDTEDPSTPVGDMSTPPRPTEATHEDVSRICPHGNTVDLEKFLMENSSTKYKNCSWVKKQCLNQCKVYYDCCPQTCSSCTKNDPASSGSSSSKCTWDNKEKTQFQLITNPTKTRNCDWVEKRCDSRCAFYSDCCPMTCEEC